MHIMAFAQPAPRGWLNPRDQSSEGYTDIDYWVEMARTCERGKLDGLFIADIMGIYDAYKGSWRPAVQHGIQSPHLDPAIVAAAITSATSDICVGVTWNTSFQAPYYTARVFSTLDHLSRGRIGWNIVTGYIKNAEQNGLGTLLSHDDRYEQAEEYLEVVYKLWEKSWEDGAIVRDRKAEMHANPDLVHEINHEGKFYSVKGPHLSEPSPQRTPVLLQAGGSPRGLTFGGKHAEVLFTVSPTVEKAAQTVERARSAAKEAGRNPNDVKVLAGVFVFVGETTEEAQRKYEEARDSIPLDAAFTLYGGWTGIDLSKYDPDDPIEVLETDGQQTVIKNFTEIEPGRKWRIRDLGDWMKGGGISPDIIGSVEEVADELERWQRESGVDGFIIQPYTSLGMLNDFVDLVVPELQSRGLLRTEYEGTTFRERLFGAGQSQLPTNHPGRNL